MMESDSDHSEFLSIGFLITTQEAGCGALKRRPAKELSVIRCRLLWYEAYYNSEILDAIGVPLTEEEGQDLLKAISRRASCMPRKSDRIFVCALIETGDGGGEEAVAMKFNVVTGIHVDEDKAISWDVVADPVNEVLKACKPPIPCLKKVKIERKEFGLEEDEDLCCSICLQDLSVGSEAAQTSCRHAYHSHCIVKWLMKSTMCPLCCSRLPIG